MRILVTGSSGFIGKSLIPKLLEDGHKVLGVNRRTIISDDWESIGNYSHEFFDLGNPEHVKTLFVNYEPHIIIHLASHATTLLNEDNPSSIIDNNIKSTYNLLENAPPRCKFIYGSSVAVYGTFTPEFTAKEMFSCYPKSMYAISKLTSERMLNVYHAQLGKITSPIVFRMCAVLGPEQDLTHGAVYDFCKKLRSNDEYLTLLGQKPGSEKPFVHINDVISAFKMAVEREDMYGIYNLCLENEINIETTAKIVMSTLKITKPLKWLGSKSNWKGDNPLIKCSNHKLRLAGWEPQYKYSQDVIRKAL